MNLLDKFLQDQARRMLEPLNDKADHTLFELDRILRGHLQNLHLRVAGIETPFLKTIQALQLFLVPERLYDAGC